MHIEKASKTDCPLILNFIRLKAEFDVTTRSSTYEVATNLEKIERALFGKIPFAYVLLLKNVGETIGFALYHIRYSSFSGSPSIWLDDVFVKESERSSGGGLQIINALTKEADKIGASHVSWTASIANTRGQKFYHLLGAKIESKNDGLLYYKLLI